MKTLDKIETAKEKIAELRDLLAQTNIGATMLEHTVLLDIISNATELQRKITIFRNALREDKTNEN